VLSLSDRCDRCGSQAYVRVDLPAGTLLFCAHHFQEHESRLRPIAIRVIDESDRLHAAASRATAYSASSS
jgi:hypothetical protein